MRWLITGGCGFIGTNLIRRLDADGGHQIRVVDNLSAGTREDLQSICGFEELDASDVINAPHNNGLTWEGRARQFIVGDILDEQLAQCLTDGADIVVHLAASTGVEPSVMNPRKDCLINVIGTLNYLEGARENGVKRFVFASSGAPLGEQEPPLHEEMPPHPVSPYGASKLAGEAYCSAYFRTFGVETVALRFGNVYGPGSGHKNSVVAKFVRQALKGERIEIHGNGSQTRDFIFVEDLVEAVVLSATKRGIGGEVFQIATNIETSLRHLIEILGSQFLVKEIKQPAVSHAEARIGDVRRSYSDTSKAMAQLGWFARTSLEEGLGRTIGWFTRNQRMENMSP